MDDPAISVVLPVHNAAPYLRESVQSILGQTFTQFELIAIDDGSTDESPAILSSFDDERLRVVRNETNLGLTATLNRGLSLARAPLTARQDADDVSHASRLERQLQAMRARPEIVLLGSQGYVVDEAGRYRGPIDRSLDADALRWWHLFDNGFIHSSVMFKTDVVRDHYGGYNPAFQYCQDYELWSRILIDRECANLPDRLISYRVHSGSMTDSMAEIREAETASVQQANWQAWLGREAPKGQDADLIAAFRTGVTAASAVRFAEALGRLARTYQRLHPTAARSDDFRMTLASQYARVAYEMLPAHRFEAARLFVLAARFAPSQAFSPVWKRVIATFLFGSDARATYTRLRASVVARRLGRSGGA